MTFANRYPDLPAVGDVVAEEDYMARDGVGRRVVASIQAVVQSQPTPGTSVPVRLAFSAANSSGALVDVTPGIVLARSAVAVSGAADTNENTLATITVPANAMGPNGFIRLFLSWTVTNNANAKTLRVRFSGASGTDLTGYNAATIAAAAHSLIIGNRNSASSQVVTRQVLTPSAGAALIGANTTTSVDTSAATTIVITCQKGTGSDTVTLDSYLAEIFYGD